MKEGNTSENFKNVFRQVIHCLHQGKKLLKSIPEYKEFNREII